MRGPITHPSSRKTPTGRRGRPYPTTTNLGKLMAHVGMSVQQMERESEVGYRVLSDILAGRKLPTPEQRRRLAEVLEVDPAKLGDYRPV